MPKKTKVRKLSDGRYSWEPKPKTLELRQATQKKDRKTSMYNVSDICQELYRRLGRGMFLNEQGKFPAWVLLQDIPDDVTSKYMVSEYNPETHYCVCEVQGPLLWTTTFSIDDRQVLLRVESSLKSVKELAVEIARNNNYRLTEICQESA